MKTRVWRISPAGQYDLAGTPPKPAAGRGREHAADQVMAVAVRPAQSGAARRPCTRWTERGALRRSGALPEPAATQVTALAAAGATFWPVAMAVDLNGDLLVLDRGDGPGSPNPPKIVTVKLQPLTVTRTPLSTVLEPLSLLVRDDGDLVIGDGGEQEQDPAGGVRRQPGPGAPTARRVDRDTAAPPGIAAATRSSPPRRSPRPTGALYVLDVGHQAVHSGLRPNPFVLAVAEPAAVYRVDLDPAAPR